MKITQKKGFVIIDVMIASGLLVVGLTIFYNSFFSFTDAYKTLELRYQNENGKGTIMKSIERIIHSSYGIDYSQTETEGDIDKLTLYADKHEKSTKTIYIEQDNTLDISRVVEEHSNGKKNILHPTNIYIEKFNIDIPEDPRGDIEKLEKHPLVGANITLRGRSKFKNHNLDGNKEILEKTKTSGSGRWLIENYFYSSFKN